MNESSPDTQLVTSTRSADGLVTSISLNRGRKMNALSPALLNQLKQKIAEAFSDDSRVILLRSAVPGVFSAGFDIAVIGTAEELPAEDVQNECSAMLENGRKVVVGFTDGLTIGGGLELFLACDLRIATSEAVFRMPPVKLARTYYMEGVGRFVRCVGLTTSTEMLLTARQLGAGEALTAGLISRTVEDTAEMEAYVATVAECPPHAQQALKAILRGLARDIARPPNSSASELAKIERAIHEAANSEDSKEALRAFSEKRAPHFVGR
jgi:enoyl-CoA hydratase/carnithine racemase